MWFPQLHDFDTCIAKNEEAIRIDPEFAECYGNMANALKVNASSAYSLLLLVEVVSIRQLVSCLLKLNAVIHLLNLNAVMHLLRG